MSDPMRALDLLAAVTEALAACDHGRINRLGARAVDSGWHPIDYYTLVTVALERMPHDVHRHYWSRSPCPFCRHAN